MWAKWAAAALGRQLAADMEQDPALISYTPLRAWTEIVVKHVSFLLLFHRATRTHRRLQLCHHEKVHAGLVNVHTRMRRWGTGSDVCSPVCSPMKQANPRYIFFGSKAHVFGDHPDIRESSATSRNGT